MSDGNSMPPYNDLIGDILKSHAKEGGMENLKGQGKPLPKEYFSGDTYQHFQRIAKDAGYKPHWLKLQHEIRDELHAISRLQAENIEVDLQDRVIGLNQKIDEHNKHCPPPMLKGRVTVESIERAKEFWK